MWLALNQLCGLHSHNPAIIIIKFIYQVSKKGGAIAPLAPPAYATVQCHILASKHYFYPFRAKKAALGVSNPSTDQLEMINENEVAAYKKLKSIHDEKKVT